MPSSFSKSRRQERHERRGRVHGGVGDPAVERHGAGLGDRADHHEHEAPRCGRPCQRQRVLRDRVHLQRAAAMPVMPMPSIRQRSATPLSTSAFTAVGEAFVPPVMIIAKSITSSPSQKKSSTHEVVGEHRAVHKGERQQQKGVKLPEMRLALHRDRGIQRDQEREARRRPAV